MSDFNFNPLQLCPKQITNLEAILLQDMHYWWQSVVQTSRMGLLLLCFTCKTSLLRGDAQRGSVFIPHVSCEVNLVTRKNKKGLYTYWSSALVIAPRTSFDSVAGVSVCFLYFFGQLFPRSWPKRDHSYSDRKTQSWQPVWKSYSTMVLKLSCFASVADFMYS